MGRRNNNKIAYGLVRVSTNQQELISQREDLRNIAKKYGYIIQDEDFFEEKVTGYDIKYDDDRRSIIELKEQITINPPDAIFIWELARLTRRAVKVSRYIDMLSLSPHIPMFFADYEIWTINPETGMPNDEGIMTLYGGAKAVELERERIIKRTKRGRDAKAKLGLFVGHVMDGYIAKINSDNEKIIAVDDDRKDVIKTIFDLYLNHEMSTSEIRDYLNANDIPTTNKYRMLHPESFVGYRKEYIGKGNIYNRDNALWVSSNVCNILRNEWYIGKRKYKGEIYSVPAIIAQDVFERVQARLTEYRVNISTATNSYLLNGILYCGKCGKKLYGHTDEYNNMYYCSSQEFGKEKRCGLRWIRQQNLDAIVFDIIKRRTIHDTTRGKKTPFSDILQLNHDKIKNIDMKIKSYQNMYENEKKKIKEYEQKLDYKIDYASKNRNNQYIQQSTDRQIIALTEDIRNADNKCIEYKLNEDKLKKEKKRLLSLKERLETINTITDFGTIKTLVRTVVVKVQLYNSDEATTVIRLHYINGKSDIALYSPSRMRKKYILLCNFEGEYHLSYSNNAQELSFPEHYLAVRDNDEWIFDEFVDTDDNYDNLMLAQGEILLPRYDTHQGKERYIASVRNRQQLGDIDENEMNSYIELYDEMVEEGTIPQSFEQFLEKLKGEGFLIFKDSISVIDYVNLRRKGTLFIHDYADLQAMSEKGLMRKEKNKEHHRRKNKGTSSSVQWIVKDVSYGEVLKERKRLYNQRYKTIRNKKVTEVEREERLRRIDDRLEVLRYQVKYMPSNAKGEKHIKKYNNSNNES